MSPLPRLQQSILRAGSLTSTKHLLGRWVKYRELTRAKSAVGRWAGLRFSRLLNENTPAVPFDP
jgi:hypothetical protein